MCEIDTKIELNDVASLACCLCDLDECVAEPSEIEQNLYDKFGIDIENFENLIQQLFNRLDLAISPLTLNAHIGFSSKSSHTWLLKKQVNSIFIRSIIEFMKNDECLDKESKDYYRTITNGVIPVFQLKLKEL